MKQISNKKHEKGTETRRKKGNTNKQIKNKKQKTHKKHIKRKNK